MAANNIHDFTLVALRLQAFASRHSWGGFSRNRR